MIICDEDQDFYSGETRVRRILGASLLAAAVLVIVTSSPSIFGLLANAISLTAVGSVKTLGVGAYWDSACTNEASTIDWGTIQPGSTKNLIIYLKNEGNTPITLSFNTTSWSPPAASTYISLGWSYSGEQISPSAVVQVTLMLNVLGSISGITSFTFDIVITGTG